MSFSHMLAATHNAWFDAAFRDIDAHDHPAKVLGDHTMQFMKSPDGRDIFMHAKNAALGGGGDDYSV